MTTACLQLMRRVGALQGRLLMVETDAQINQWVQIIDASMTMGLQMLAQATR
jgi:hypothetical protein